MWSADRVSRLSAAPHTGGTIHHEHTSFYTLVPLPTMPLLSCSAWGALVHCSMLSSKGTRIRNMSSAPI